jgi:hypothetical protein
MLSLVLITYDKSRKVLEVVLFLFCVGLRDFERKILRKIGELRVDFEYLIEMNDQ